MSLRDVYIVDAVRTPVGKYNGALASVRPDDLAAHAIRALLARTPDLDPALVGDVCFGNANGAGEENRNVGAHGRAARRTARHRAGRDRQPPFCASGLEAVVQAARAIAVGDLSVRPGRRRRVG
ncbi:acetyl-CoA C-acyltransferase OS=Streptomyces alboniger OX=132473 GN=CP975_31505 PE=3 SV=1 [Streptomyces alboniger]